MNPLDARRAAALRGLAFLALFSTAPLSAAVPNRITYQGRLSQSGAPKGGRHDFELKLVNPANASDVWASTSVTKVLSPTGDFSLTLEILVDRDWLEVNPALELKVDGKPMSPNEVFSTTPYAFAAKVAERVKDLGDFPVFSAYSNATQRLDSLEWTVVKFAQKEFDSHNAYNATDDGFTPPVPGYYQLCASVSSDSIDASKALEFCFAKNGQCWRTGALSDQGASGAVRVTGCTIVHASGSESFQIKAYFHSTGGSFMTLNPAGPVGDIVATYFQGHRVK